MNSFESLELAFKKSFEDKYFSKTERDAIRQLLAAASLKKDDKDVLRSKLFAMAKSTAKDNDTAFVIEWLDASTRILDEKVDQPAPKGSSVYFSPGDACLNAIIAQINSAQKELDVCVFTISDDRISTALIAKHKAKVNVRILTDNEKLLDEGSDISKLAKAGLPIRVDRTTHHMHHKFLVVDRLVTVTGSYNWTRSAAQFNEENIVVTTEHAVAQAYLREFERMWALMEPF